ncbi:hypothetical protein RISK_006072 [Rhodopirellula islandica]|uniref:Uncharacterized protein n=1 Tax=Rhodopirellula islandica TaxID=595434 RepID=A0A0J1B5N4_RHOIS|nr:hypothetical protein RISK_006072 [Rhodopirellula islandica]
MGRDKSAVNSCDLESLSIEHLKWTHVWGRGFLGSTVLLNRHRTLYYDPLSC